MVDAFAPPPPGDGAEGLLIGDPARAFVVALRNGLEWLFDHPVAWDHLFRQADEEELATIRSYFSPGGPGGRIKIRKGYPTRDMQAPEITVLSLEDSPDESFLADVIAARAAFMADEVEVRAEVHAQVLAVTVLAPHPDVALYLATACDSILLAHKDWFMRPADAQGAGFIDASWQRTADLAVEPGREPERLWGRQIRWLVRALGGTILPIPPPPTGVSVNLAGVVVSGRSGKVRVG